MTTERGHAPRDPNQRAKAVVDAVAKRTATSVAAAREDDDVFQGARRMPQDVKITGENNRVVCPDELDLAMPQGR